MEEIQIEKKIEKKQNKKLFLQDIFGVRSRELIYANLK